MRGKQPPPLLIENLEHIAYVLAGKKSSHAQVIQGFINDGLPQSVVDDYKQKYKVKSWSDDVYVLYDNWVILEIFQACLMFPACFDTVDVVENKRTKRVYIGMIPSQVNAVMQMLGKSADLNLVATLANYYIKTING